jgi:fatty acid desaturase
VLAGVVFIAHAGALVAVPRMGFAAPWMLYAFACAAALLTPMHWALIHEGIHGVLLPGRVANEALARMLAILFGVPFRAVRFAHLRHHRYNRTPWGREEVYDPATQSRPLAYAMHYLRITFGLYVGELALSLVCWLPRSILRPRLLALCPDLRDGTQGMAAIIDRDVLGASSLAQIRFDAACVIALYASAFAAYAERWPVLAAMLLIRAFISSQLDHAPHHDTPLDRRNHALNLSAPHWLHCLLLNFNLHRTHHQRPSLPWSALPQFTKFEAGDITFVSAVLRQWWGPVALQDAGRQERDLICRSRESVAWLRSRQ